MEQGLFYCLYIFDLSIDSCCCFLKTHADGTGGHNPVRAHLIDNKKTILQPQGIPADLVSLIASYVDEDPVPIKTLFVGPTLTVDTIQYFPRSADRIPQPTSP